MKKSIALVLLAAAACLSTAQAAIITMNRGATIGEAYSWLYFVAGAPASQGNSALSFSGGVSAYQSQVTVNQGDAGVATGTQFYTFDADIFQDNTAEPNAATFRPMTDWAMWGYGSDRGLGTPGGNAAKLYNGNGGATKLASEDAWALQLAIWEVLYEINGPDYDVTTGGAQIKNASTFNPTNTATFNRIVAKANQMLAELPNSTASDQASWIVTQDIGTMGSRNWPWYAGDLIGPAVSAPVPLPGAALQMLTGLAGLIGLRLCRLRSS